MWGLGGGCKQKGEREEMVRGCERENYLDPKEKMRTNEATATRQKGTVTPETGDFNGRDSKRTE